MTPSEIRSIYGVDVTSLPQESTKLIYIPQPVGGPILEIQTGEDFRSNIYISKKGSFCWLYDGVNANTRTFLYRYLPSPLIGNLEDVTLHYFRLWGDYGVTGSLSFSFDEKDSIVQVYISNTNPQASIRLGKARPYMQPLDYIFSKWGKRQMIQRPMDHSDTRLSFVGD